MDRSNQTYGTVVAKDSVSRKEFNYSTYETQRGESFCFGERCGAFSSLRDRSLSQELMVRKRDLKGEQTSLEAGNSSPNYRFSGSAGCVNEPLFA